METLLRALLLAALAAGPAGTGAQETRADDHVFRLSVELPAASTSSSLAAWPEGGLGKLRFDDGNDLGGGSRIALDYAGRLQPTLWARVVADYVDDAASGLDVVEAYLVWRPVPKRPSHHQLRVGAFYPPLSFENSGPAWSSPYTISFSAINTWLGEEIRPLGLEWTLRRRIGGPTSASQFSAFAAAFYGNDPAATLLFWRGWSLHDRQTRLNDKLVIPPLPSFGVEPRTYTPQAVEPVTEIDSRPGFYTGAEWTLGRRVKVQTAHFDNRADPQAFRDNQWGWNTRFSTLGLQLSLPQDIGLIAQAMSGRTTWIAGARPDGTIGGSGPLVTDHFDARFVLLTRTFSGEKHRVTARWDSFDIERPVPPFPIDADAGSAQTLAYRYNHAERIAIAVEWLRIRSTRDLWSNFYALPREATERQVRAQFSLGFEL